MTNWKTQSGTETSEEKPPAETVKTLLSLEQNFFLHITNVDIDIIMQMSVNRTIPHGGKNESP